MSVIVVEQLTKRYGRRVGVERLSFTVPEGAVFGFLGPNGAGKTTTIRVLLGLLRPTAGKARIFEADCWRSGHRIKADVGYVPGDLRLYPWLTCRVGLRIFGQVRGRELAGPGGELAEEFELDPELRVRSMSRGMRQKLGLILALAHRPKLLILDEPTTSLDPLMRERLYGRLRALASLGHTVFFSSHTLSEVEQLCDRVALLREGRLVADEELDALRSRAKRVVIVRWREVRHSEEKGAPGFLAVQERTGREWHATLTGSATELVRWSAHQPIEDLSIEEPDLATLFQQHYASQEPGA